MKIFCISGKARHGKDFTAENFANDLRLLGKKVLITHNADLLKFICKNMFGWNGEKDEQGRHILQYVGTDIVRKQKPDFWVDFLISVFQLFPNEWDYVLIPDCRFPNEIDKLKEAGFDVTYIRVERVNTLGFPFDNGLSEEAKLHISENALNDYKPDILITNNGTPSYLTIIQMYSYFFEYGISIKNKDGTYRDIDDVIMDLANVIPVKISK